MTEAMSSERLAELKAHHHEYGINGATDGDSIISELLDEVERARKAEAKLRTDLAEMTRCRNNAMAYADREHVPIELDEEIDTDGEELASRIEGELLGPGWDWDDDRTPGLLARTAVGIIRPHLARLTDQAQAARAQLAEVGEPELEWGVRATIRATGRTEDASQPTKESARARVARSNGASVLICRIKAGKWRVAEDGG